MTQQCNDVLGPFDPAQRADTASMIRVKAAEQRKNQGSAPHPNNGDDHKYADRNFCASFTKGLPHYDQDSVEGYKGEVKRPADIVEFVQPLRAPSKEWSGPCSERLTLAHLKFPVPVRTERQLPLRCFVTLFEGMTHQRTRAGTEWHGR